MSDRLLGISTPVVVAGIVGLVAAIVLYRYGLGVRIPDYPVGKAEIAARARTFAVAHGLGAPDGWVVVETVYSDRSQLSRRIGAEATQHASLSRALPVAAWRSRLRTKMFTSDANGDPGRVTIGFNELGDVLSASWYEPNAKAPAPSRDEARTIALERLADLDVDLTGYVERTSDEKKKPGSSTETGPVIVNMDDEPDSNMETRPPAQAEKTGDVKQQRFVWERSDGAVEGVRPVVKATVTASGLTAFSREMEFDSALLPPSGVATIIQGTVFGVFITIFVLLLFGLCVFRLVARDFVSFRRTLVVVAFFCMTVVLTWMIETTMDESLVVGAIGAIFIALFASVPVFCAWFAGEADAYFAWGKHMTEAPLAFLTFRPHARQVARESLEGTLWGWAILGVLAVVATVVALAGGKDAVHRAPELVVAGSHPVWLFPITVLPYTIATVIFGHLFTTSWAQRLTRRPKLSIGIASAVVGLLAAIFNLADLGFGPLPGSLSWGVPFGIATCLLATRRGLLAAGMATFTFSTFFFGIGALGAGSIGDRVAGLAGLAIAATPAMLSLAFGRYLPQVEVFETPPPRLSRLLEQARRQEELNIAQRVQSGLLPSSDPHVEGFDVAGSCRPANEVGGDYFDYFRSDDGKFGVAVGDVSGKGVPAAFFMTLTKGFMEVAAAEEREPVGVLLRANDNLRDNLTRSTFVTMAYAVLDPESRIATFARAGHNPPAFVRSGAPPAFVNTSGTALGAAARPVFEDLLESKQIELRHGDTLVFYTDGVTEAMNPHREQFGEERLLDALERHRTGLTARELVDALLAEIADFAADAHQHDDITIVVVKVA